LIASTVKCLGYDAILFSGFAFLGMDHAGYMSTGASADNGKIRVAELSIQAVCNMSMMYA
jgi:hypothetical protein